MKVTNNYPAMLQEPFPKKKANINGKLFFKYRQQFRNKTRYEEGITRILSFPAPNLFNHIPNSRMVSKPITMRRKSK